MRLIVLALLTALSLTLAAERQPAVAQDVFAPAAVVNDEVISQLDLEARLRLALLASGLPDNEESYQQIVGPVLRQLVDERLQIQEARRLDLAVSDREIAEGVGNVAQRNDMAAEDFLAFLSQNGVPHSAIRGQVRASISWNKILSRRVVPDVQITEEEIDQAVERILGQGDQVRVRLAEIFLPFGGASEEEDAYLLSQRLIDQLQRGIPFQQLAAQFSEAPTAAMGGDAGYLLESELPGDIADVVATMQPGELAGPVPTVNGFYILLVIDRQQSGAAAGGDANLRLTQILFEAPSGREEEAMRQAEAATAGIGSCAEAETVAQQAGLPGSGDMGQIRASDMPQELRGLLVSQSIGRPSPPIRLADTVMVLVVCEREMEGGGVDREFVAESLRRDRLDMLSARYMRDLRRSANVDIRL